ncbi:unnamed protein product [marine sediment metagenome]|uniref:Uncharacterized protein n=1 Tax=marine sediment metagenome TaxID=412755 RepID=X1S6F9_9ZZZZ
MYAIKVEPPDDVKPVIDRSMSSNTALEIIPVLVEICRLEFSMANPVALHMGNNIYRIFDINNPSVYAQVSIIKDAN